jgi:hypothetical protein
MNSEIKIAEEMKKVLEQKARELGRESGFIKREVKLDGAKFVQMLVFGWMSNPQATYEEMAQTATTLGIDITSQSIEERFSPLSAEFLKKVLEETIKVVVRMEQANIPILERFQGVYIKDSSTITLPDELKKIWKGCGGTNSEQAQSALKLQVQIDIKSGRISGLYLADGKEPDVSSKLNNPETMELEENSIHIGDLGYWSIKVFREIEKQSSYFLSRLKTRVLVYENTKKAWPVVKILEKKNASQLDTQVKIGEDERFACRLLAVKVPPEVAAERRRKWNEEAKEKGKTVSKARLAQADYSVFITNVPVNLLSLKEALVLARCRWQIELLFKLWKSYGQVDKSRSHKPYRILSEVYAKLIIMLIQHWILIAGCWNYPNRSLPKAVKHIQKMALFIACSFSNPFLLSHCLSIVFLGFPHCLMNKRKARPNNYQLLFDTDNLAALPKPFVFSLCA